MSKTMNLYLITSLEFLCPVVKVCPCSLTPLSLKGKEKKHFLFVKLLACVNVQYDCSIGATVYFQVCLWDFSFPLDSACRMLPFFPLNLSRNYFIFILIKMDQEEEMPSDP